MSALTPDRPRRSSITAPFKEPGFIYQWPADVAASVAFDMETIILAWYVFVETHSVTMLTIFASMQYLGTLVAPMFGVMGDRIGHRYVLAAMRGVYAACATTLLILITTGWINPYLAVGVAAIMGLVRPSDVGMRAAVTSDSMPPHLLVSAMGLQRSSQDLAKFIGSLSGAATVVALGMGPAYCVVVSLYGFAMWATLKGAAVRVAAVGARPERSEIKSPWRDLREGAVYVWRTPFLLATMILAALLNFTAFPLTYSLMPIVAKEVYHTGQTGLSYLIAAGACGAMVGSLFMGRIAHHIRPGRMMLMGAAAWLSVLLIFAQTTGPGIGLPLIALAGLAQTSGLVPMLAALLKNAHPAFRGRIMGIRMLSIYSNIPGVLIAGPLVAHFGYAVMASSLCVFGLVAVLLIALRWREHLWRKDALSNTR